MEEQEIRFELKRNVDDPSELSFESETGQYINGAPAPGIDVVVWLRRQVWQEHGRPETLTVTMSLPSPGPSQEVGDKE